MDPSVAPAHLRCCYCGTDQLRVLKMYWGERYVERVVLCENLHESTIQQPYLKETHDHTSEPDGCDPPKRARRHRTH